MECTLKIVIAPDSFKESLSALEVAQSVRSGFAEVFPDAEYVLVPVGDGGEGTLDVLKYGLDCREEYITVHGPFDEQVNAKILFSQDNKTAIIEMAETCGLQLVPLDKRNPLKVSTKGVGELIVYALDNHVEEIIIGVGGSASIDGGIGMARGLGYRFFDKDNNEVEAIGDNLEFIYSIDESQVHERLKNTKITIMSDVENTLCGESGAAAVFGPQKGLPHEKIGHVDLMLKNFFEKFAPDIMDMNGTGAGGGISCGLIAFANAMLESGIDFVLQSLKMEEICRDADLVIVGEGRMDAQSVNGKAPIGVARSIRFNIPIIAICGSVGDDLDTIYDNGIVAVFPIVSSPCTLEEAFKKTEVNLRRTARNVAVMFRG